MQISTGKIYESKQEALSDGVTEIDLEMFDRADATDKQLRESRVSKTDCKSVLGEKLSELRNKPCPRCNSGRKFKKCCMKNMVSSGELVL